MPQIQPIHATTFSPPPGGDISALIAPPYDVLSADSKAALLDVDPKNIVAIDLPHLPPKTVGPDATYQQAGDLYRQWLSQSTLQTSTRPAVYAYRQTFSLTPDIATASQPAGKTIQRVGLIANVGLQTLGTARPGSGGIYPHEQTFSAPKEDRLKLMRATRAQLSPIFGMYSDQPGQITTLLQGVIDSSAPTLTGTTAWDGVFHELWPIDTFAQIDNIAAHLEKTDVLIADGHHRYNTALNYRQELTEGGELSPDHPANFCMFVLIATQDPGMLLLPTHRVLGGMSQFSLDRFVAAAGNKLRIKQFNGDGLRALEQALPAAGPHAIGLYDPGSPAKMMIATTPDSDPLAKTHPDQSAAWRSLDVAIVQHLIVEQICQPSFCPNAQEVAWKFPHTLAQVEAELTSPDFQLGLIMQSTPLEAVSQVSEARELMPQKSTFFYPKVATGMVIHPLE